MSGITRRQVLGTGLVLGGAGVALSPIEQLLDIMTLGMIKQAHAESLGIEGVRNYVNVNLTGAPMRYAFDQWLRTSSSESALIYNPMVNTKMVSSGGRVTGVEYGTFEKNGILVPHMFSHSVFTSAGSVPLSQLLENMLVIRGYGTGFDGHTFNNNVQQGPVGGVSSIAGVAADYSNKTFEAIQWPDRGGYRSFSSSKGKALNVLPGGTPLNALLQGFMAPPAARAQARSLKDRRSAEMDLARARLGAYVNANASGSKVLNQNMQNAVALMKKGVGNIDGYWSEAVARYTDIISRSARATNLPGISDVPMISQENAMWSIHVAQGNRGMILSKDFDARSIISQIDINSFATQFALIEYVLKENLASSVEVLSPDFMNLMALEKGEATAAAFYGIKDMHETGAITGLLLSVAYYRGLSAAILELATQLGKAKTTSGTSVWSETVVHVIGDFGRSARSSGGGSDHGYNQMSSSVFSGAFGGGPYVVGNIRKTGHNGSYDGTQGIGAAIDGYNQAGMPTPTMAASTVVELLRAPKNPYVNLAAPLVKLEGGRLNYAFGKGKLVG